jgi:DNA segregation ATPase FtsK/SpoIIIE-like protein
LIAADFLAGADEVEEEDTHVPVDGEGTRVDMTEQKALPPAPEEVNVEYHVTTLEDASLPLHSGEVLKVMAPEEETIDAEVVEDSAPVENPVPVVEEPVAEAPVVENSVSAVDAAVADCRVRIEAGLARLHTVETPIAEIDVKAVEQRVAADLAAKDDDRDPLFDEAKEIMDSEFNEDTSPAVGALTFQRRFRIGTARALNLFKAIKELEAE